MAAELPAAQRRCCAASEIVTIIVSYWARRTITRRCAANFSATKHHPGSNRRSRGREVFCCEPATKKAYPRHSFLHGKPLSAVSFLHGRGCVWRRDELTLWCYWRV